VAGGGGAGRGRGGEELVRWFYEVSTEEEFGVGGEGVEEINPVVVEGMFVDVETGKKVKEVPSIEDVFLF
jgi:hypothetical protein